MASPSPIPAGISKEQAFSMAQTEMEYRVELFNKKAMEAADLEKGNIDPYISNTKELKKQKKTHERVNAEEYIAVASADKPAKKKSKKI